MSPSFLGSDQERDGIKVVEHVEHKGLSSCHRTEKRNLSKLAENESEERAVKHNRIATIDSVMTAGIIVIILYLDRLNKPQGAGKNGRMEKSTVEIT